MRVRGAISIGVWLIALSTMATIFWVEQGYVRQLQMHNIPEETSIKVKVPVRVMKENRLPNVLVIGAMKAGTSTLMRYLDFHPDVQCSLKEVNFFDNDDNYNQGLEWYREQMPRSLPGQLVIEKSPAYMQWTKKVPERVCAYNSSIKLIIILKDPLKRTVSHYTHRLAVGLRGLKHFYHYVIDTETHKVRTNSLLVNTSMYYDRIHDWFKWFPHKQFLILNGEQFVKRPWQVLQEAETFLGIKPFFRREQFQYNSTKGFFCFKTGAVQCMGKSKGRPHPAVKLETLEKLQNFFNIENQKLYFLLNRTFDWPTVVSRSDSKGVIG